MVFSNKIILATYHLMTEFQCNLIYITDHIDLACWDPPYVNTLCFFLMIIPKPGHLSFFCLPIVPWVFLFYVQHSHQGTVIHIHAIVLFLPVVQLNFPLSNSPSHKWMVLFNTSARCHTFAVSIIAQHGHILILKTQFFHVIKASTSSNGQAHFLLPTTRG